MRHGDFIAVKNRYLNLSAVLKFTKTQNEPKPAETKSVFNQYFLTTSTTRQILTIPFISKKSFIYWAF